MHKMYNAPIATYNRVITLLKAMNDNFRVTFYLISMHYNSDNNAL